jgi:hypothetical protein
VSRVNRIRGGVKRSQVVTERGRRAAKAKLKAADLHDAPLDLSRATYLTLAECANYMRLSTGAVKMRKKRGAIPGYCYSYVGGSLRFIREAIDELFQKKERVQLARTGADAVHGERG